MEELFEKQSKLGDEIERIIRNFKKDSDERKDLKYYKHRLSQLQAVFDTFKENHVELTKCMDRSHEYFTKDYYMQLTVLCEKYTKHFRQEIITLDQQRETEGNDFNNGDVIEKGASGGRTSNNEDVKNGLIRKAHRKMLLLESRLSTTEVLKGQSTRYYDLKVAFINQLWHEIALIDDSIWEQQSDPVAFGYNIERFQKLEQEVHLKVTEITLMLNEPNYQLNSQPSKSTLPIPKVKISTFDGDYLKWNQFHDLFTELVHKQPLSNVEKMWHLKTQLAGEASNFISHLATTDENYVTAWRLLEERYGNKRILASTLVKKLVDQPSGTSNLAAVKHLHDTTRECLLALNNLGIETNSWDPLLIHILIKKLDRNTYIQYEQSIARPKELPKISELLSFLELQYQTMETIGHREKQKTPIKVYTSTTKQMDIKLCASCGKKSHPLFICDKFLSLKVHDRIKFVQKQKLCLNCLKPGHAAVQCAWRHCTKCSKKHNSLLHLIPQEPATVKLSNEAKENSPATVTTTNHTADNNKYVILATAKIRVVANNGQACEIRAILDSGSQINIVTQRLVNKLSLTTSRSQLCIEGIGQQTGISTSRVNVEIHSRTEGFSTRIEAYVMPKLISSQPARDLEVTNWNIPGHLSLADPEFFKSGKIDMLIGAELYHSLIRPEQLTLKKNLPLLQNTVFGWIVIGKTEMSTAATATCNVATKEEENLDAILEKFWRLDDYNNANKAMAPVEKWCENHFANNIKRDISGRFVTRLLFAENPTVLGKSKDMAINRFFSLEKRLQKDSAIKSQYIKFMNEYEALGHMEKIWPKDVPDIHYFIPHHCVLKPDSSTTKLRVVFDASAKTSSGQALNDILHKGPSVQSELFSVLLRFRTHRYVFTADIEKMYRQIGIHEEDTAQQLIVWRKDPNEVIQYYRLKTVTYGTTSAPYLATKCLQYLAKQNMNKYPQGAKILLEDFYVDDCLSGANDITTALESQRQLTQLLQEAGFKLRKWCSNNSKLLASIPLEDQEVNLDLDDKATKTLGLIWLPKSDKLCGRAHLSPIQPITKRVVSSDLARIFDPLGIFGPVIVSAKMFMQELWQQKYDWDEKLPHQTQREWQQFRKNILDLNNLKVPRCIFQAKPQLKVQLHTFVDASERAYGAAIYVRTTYKDRTITSNLLCAKSRIAPLKLQTLPRLELCAAVLGVEVTERVKQDLKYQDVSSFFWSDSEIVLSWIKSAATSLHTFVANRVSRIQELSHTDQWHHVSSKNNPADVISRGINPDLFSACSIWFYGPLFLHGSQEPWLKPTTKLFDITDDIERRKTTTVAAIASSPEPLEVLIYGINHKNSFRFLQHTVAYMLRFIENSKKPKLARPNHISICATEMMKSLTVIIKTIQMADFKTEIKELQKYKQLSKSNQLSSLCPFLDDQNIMRVGGRLEASSLGFDAKHPVLLPYNDSIVKILLVMMHEDNKHCGPKALLATSRQKFWIVKGKTMTRNTVHNCVRCVRAKPKLYSQVMANLPADRVTESRPFLTSGVDYCGPIWIHYKIRGKRPQKAYIAVFCCFATKAVHLEIVSDLTTEAFIGALKRFISRRGRCQKLYSDNATNFVGAKNQLTELQQAVFSHPAQEKIVRSCSDKGIEFKFIPPKAPHFGGLWEAAVKSAKHHLYRSVSTSSLTYEELETVVVEIEAILNSRPLTPLSSDPNDIGALTPGHFIIGEPLTTPVDSRATENRRSLKTNWKYVSDIKHRFWTRWHHEYLHELQQRSKWKDNVPVLQWPLGRIIRIYKGNDGFTRVVDVKTASGISKRPIHELAPLFSEEEIEKMDPTTSTQNNNQKRQCSYQHDDVPKPKSASKGLALSVMLFSLLLLPLALASPIKVSRFRENPGLYFEGMGTARLSTGVWKIIVFYDLAPFHYQINSLSDGITTLRRLCLHPTSDISCSSLIDYFESVRNQLHQEENLLSSSRQKRGAFDIIGNVAHTLFGVLDSDYAEQMSNTIKEVEVNEDYLLKLLKNQTSIIDSTINIIKQDEVDTFSRLEEIQRLINMDINKIEDTAAQLRLTQQLTILITQLSMNIADLQHTQLAKEILTIKGHLPTTWALPIEDINLLELYTIMDVKAGLTKNHVIFELALPLVDHKKLELFLIHPIPITVNGTLVEIKPTTEMLAVSGHRDQYIALNLAEINAAMLISDDIYIINERQATIGKQSKKLACEIQLFNNKTSQSCNLSTCPDQLLFMSLHHANKWIYATTVPTEVTAVCNHEPAQLTLIGSGVLTIDQHCILKNDDIQIQGYVESASRIYTSFAGIGNMSSISQPSELKVLLKPSFEHFETKLEQLTDLQDKLSREDFEHLPHRFKSTSIHLHVVSYLSLIVLLCASITYITCKMRKHYSTKATSPQPMPRQHKSEFEIEIT